MQSGNHQKLPPPSVPGDVRSGLEACLAQEANHRIANQLTHLAGHIQNQIRSIESRGPTISRAEALLVLRGVSARIAAFGRHHRELARQPAGSDVDLSEYLVEICGLTLSQLGVGDRVRFVYRLDGTCQITGPCAHALTLVLCEIIMNAVKYAHPAGLPVLITVVCVRQRDGMVVEISDDGVGLPDGFDAAKSGGMGLRIIRALAAQMGAALAIESDCLGLTYRFALPAAT